MLSVGRNEQWPPSTCLRLQQGVGEGGREVEEKGGVASTEPAGVVMAAGAGTMKSRMNTEEYGIMARPQAVVSCLIILHVHVVFARLTLLMSCVLLASQGVAGEEGGRPPGAGVVAVVRHGAAEEATTSSRHAKVGVL